MRGQGSRAGVAGACGREALTWGLVPQQIGGKVHPEQLSVGHPLLLEKSPDMTGSPLLIPLPHQPAGTWMPAWAADVKWKHSPFNPR